MKGRFRKGKKAFRKQHGLSGKQIRLKGRYVLFLAKRLAKRPAQFEAAVRGVRCAVAVAMGTAQVAFTKSQHGITKAQNAFRILQVAMDTANGLTKSFQDEV